MKKVKQSKKQIKPIDLDNTKARHFTSETSSGRFLALSLFTLLTIIAAAICEFLKAIQIKDYDTAPLPPPKSDISSTGYFTRAFSIFY